MATSQDKIEIRKEIKNHYTNEINILKNIKKTIEELEGQIGECTYELQQVQMSKIEFEDKIEDKIYNFKNIKDSKSSLELSNIKKELNKEVKKLRQNKISIEKYILHTTNKLDKNGLKINQNKKSVKNYIDRWIFLIQNTYKEIYNT